MVALVNRKFAANYNDEYKRWFADDSIAGPISAGVRLEF